MDLKGIDLRCGAGRVAALECPRHSIHCRSRSIPGSHTKQNTPADGRSVCLVDLKGIDLRCGAGRVAALECPRHSIHCRSRSNPGRVHQKETATPYGMTASFWRSGWDLPLRGINFSSLIKNKNPPPDGEGYLFLAERVGFEPTCP